MTKAQERPAWERALMERTLRSVKQASDCTYTEEHPPGEFVEVPHLVLVDRKDLENLISWVEEVMREE